MIQTAFDIIKAHGSKLNVSTREKERKLVCYSSASESEYKNLLMRFAIGVLFLCFACKPAFTQNDAAIDSFAELRSRETENRLRQQLAASREDTNKVLLLHDLFYVILFSKPDSAMYLVQEGLKLAQRMKFSRGESFCKTDIGAVWWIIGNYSEAQEIMLESLEIAELNKDPKAIEWALAFLLSNSRDQGNQDDALKYALRGAAIHQYLNTKIWNVIIGSVYQQMNKPDSALYYLQKGDSSDYNFLLLGHTYAEMKRNDLASSFYKKATSELSRLNNLKDLTDAYIGLALLYEKENKPDSATYYAKKGLDIAQNASFKKWVYETSIILSRVYEKTDKEEALHYFKLAMAAKDSMFNIQEITNNLSNRYNEQLRQKEVETTKMNYENKIRIYVLLGTISVFLLLAIILYRSNMQKQKAKAKIEQAYGELKSAQAQLIQSEKMASLGELTAGIAHEIQNPLNFVNNFSEVNGELIEELKGERSKVSSERDEALEDEIINDIKQNLEKINHHGKRADAIVKGMLQHSKTSTGIKEPTDINKLAEEYLRLAYHGMRAKDKEFNATLQTDFDANIGKINVVQQDIGRVLLNLFNNAFYAINEKQKDLTGSSNLSGQQLYIPTVTIVTKKLNDKIEIKVSDNGNGIPQNIVDKIFQPFFTSKPTGQGTGLGLSLAYDIVKAHRGEIKVQIKEREGSEFIIWLPIV